jgi:hypothetical protein
MPRAALRRQEGESEQSQPRTRFGYVAGYSTVDNERLEALAAVPKKDGGLTDREFRILQWYIGATPGVNEPVMKTTAWIADRTAMTADALGRIVRTLVKKRLLLYAGEFGRQRFYKVTPYLSSQGSSAEQRDAIRDYNPPDIPGLRDRLKGDLR